MQLIIGLFSLVILLFTSIARPFQRSGHNEFSLLQLYCDGLLFSLVLKMGVLEDVEDSNLLSDELRASYIFDQRRSLSSHLHLAGFRDRAWFWACQVSIDTEGVSSGGRARGRHARGRLSNPPMHSWELRQGNRYCVFLSHFKEEAGSDARYLSDLIRRKTGCAAYLDSNDLVDLRTLFSEGELTI